MRNVTLLLLFFLTCYSFISRGESTFHTASLLELNENQKGFLEEDSPLRDIRIFTNQSLWILGQKFLWRYQIESKELEQVNFDSTPLPSFKIQALLAHKNSLYLASDDTLFQIVDTGKLKFFSYTSLAEENSITNSLQRDPLGFIHWITSDGVQTIDPLTRQIIDFKKASFPEGHFLYFLKGFSYFEIEESRLYRKDIKEGKRELLEESEENFSELKRAGSFLYLFEEKKLHLLQTNGEKIQTLSIQEDKRLYEAKITEDFDAYLFTDNTLEIHYKEIEKTKHYSIPLPQREKIISFETNGTYLASFSPKEIFIFKLEDKL